VKEWAERLAGWIRRGRVAFPTLELEPEVAAAWFLARVGVLDPLPQDERVPAEDLYLACACASGSDAAIEVFAARHLQRLAPALRHAGLEDTGIAEVEQELVALLFVGDGAPHILTYGGRGDLHAWLKSIAVRMALRRREHDARHAGDEALVDLAAADDPGLEHLRKTAGAELRASFAAALASLSAADRTLLRQHHLDGVTLDALATTHQVHRATIARRLAAARQAVADRTRDELVARLGLATAELDSVVRLVQSQLDLSLRRQLDE
jgi:RNA polymerase sigma-70 factor (ECF subfamily)